MSIVSDMTYTIWLLGVLATSNLSFNPSKSICVSCNHKSSISYNIRSNFINTTHNHKDLGVTISDNLNWNILNDAILSKTNRTLGLYKEL